MAGERERRARLGVRPRLRTWFKVVGRRGVVEKNDACLDVLMGKERRVAWWERERRGGFVWR